MKNYLVLILFFSTFLAFGQNPPTIDPPNIPAVPPLCSNQPAQIYDSLGITDLDFDLFTITSIQSSNQSVLPTSSISWNFLDTVGNVQYFSVSGTPLGEGTVTLTLAGINENGTASFTLPPFTISLVTEPVFTTSLIALCANTGVVDLFDYVDLPGGNFYSNNPEMDFEDGLFDTDNSLFETGDVVTLSYEVNTGACAFYTETQLVIRSLPVVTVSKTPTVCAQSTGTATATITGGASSYSFTQWSSGQQNTTSVTGLAAGQYEFSVTDTAGCQSNHVFEITTTGASITADVQNVLCYGGNSGSISLSYSGLVAPVSVLWSSGHSSLNITGLAAGDYTVQLTDAAGCLVLRTVTVTQPEPLSTAIDYSWPSCGNADGSAEVYDIYGGVAPYSYSWSNGGTGTTISNIGWGVYTLVTTDANGCTDTASAFVSESNSAYLYGEVTGTSCGTAEGAIDLDVSPPFGSSVASIAWSNGAATEDIASLLPDLYICTLITTNNCTAVGGWYVPITEPLRNDICVVTVDNSTTTNLVVWERVQTTGIAYYNIYRETTVPGFFALIDTVQAANISLFNDVVASPMAKSWSYKIAAVDACGVEGPLSNSHRTIHLDVLDQGGTSVAINWNPYEGAAFSNYIISRYTDAFGWEEIASVPAAQLSYTDTTAITTPGLDYVVEIELDEMCSALIYRAQDFNSSRSNKDKGAFSPGNGTGQSNNGLDEAYLSAISIHPNPATDAFTIVQTANEQLVIEVRSVDGQLVRRLSTSQLSETVNIAGLSNGIYFVTVGMNTTQQTTRVVKF